MFQHYIVIYNVGQHGGTVALTTLVFALALCYTELGAEVEVCCGKMVWE